MTPQLPLPSITQPGHPSEPIWQGLTFSLTPELKAMIPATQVREILVWELQQVVPIFDAPEAVIGVGSYRGEVLWLADLPALLGLTPLHVQTSSHSYALMVVQQEKKVCGFAVAAMGQLLSCNSAQLQSDQPSHLPLKLALCLRGIYRDPRQGELLVLEVNKLLKLLNVNAKPQVVI